MPWWAMSPARLEHVFDRVVIWVDEFVRSGAAYPKADPRERVPTRKFDHFPHVLFVMDDENQLVQKGKGREYQSGHKGHSVKHVSTLNADGRVVWVSEPQPGAEHDFKTTKETKGLGHGFTIEQFFTADHGTHLPILAAGRFQGLGRLVPGSILPRRKPANAELDSDDEACNTITHDRIIVENFYGRKKRLWRMAKDQYSGTIGHPLKLVTATTWLTDLSELYRNKSFISK
jgi:hypothetical protein